MLVLPSPEFDTFVASAIPLPDTKDLVKRAAQCLTDMARSRLNIALNALSLLGGISDADAMAFLMPAPSSSRDSGSTGRADTAVTPGTLDSVRSADEMAMGIFEWGPDDNNPTATSFDGNESQFPLEPSFEEMESALMQSGVALDAWEYGSYGPEANQFGVKF